MGVGPYFANTHANKNRLRYPGSLDVIEADKFSLALVESDAVEPCTEIVVRLLRFNWDPQHLDRCTVIGFDDRLEFRRYKAKPKNAPRGKDKGDLDFGDVLASETCTVDGPDAVPADGQVVAAFMDAPAGTASEYPQEDADDEDAPFAYIATHCPDGEAAAALANIMQATAGLDAEDAAADQRQADERLEEETGAFIPDARHVELAEYLENDARIRVTRGTVHVHDEFLFREIPVGRVDSVGAEYYKAACTCRHKMDSSEPVTTRKSHRQRRQCSLFLKCVHNPVQCEVFLNKWLALGYQRDLTFTEHQEEGRKLRRAAEAFWLDSGASSGAGASSSTQ